MTSRKTIIVIVLVIAVIFGSLLIWEKYKQTDYIKANIFDSDRAYSLLVAQVALGPRFTGTAGHDEVVKFIEKTLSDSGREVFFQTGETTLPSGEVVPVKNVIGRYEPSRTRRVILATHYDTRALPERDPVRPNGVFVGANDGASGVAVLLELADKISSLSNNSSLGFDFVFFDGEELGDSFQSEWRGLGSALFVEKLTDWYPLKLPEQIIVVDMVGDSDLQLKPEGLSFSRSPELVRSIWQIGHDLFPGKFFDKVEHVIYDDHYPFTKINIPAALIIDFDYPYWHTEADTLDTCSSRSLGVVGQTLFFYLNNYADR
jgi:hypothetical protein